MNKAIAACFAASFSISVSAQDAFVAPLVEQSVLLDVAATDYAIVVGERGHILKSTDGSTFSQVSVPSRATLTATTIVGNNVWAVGHDAVILHSSDSGDSWEVQNLQPELERPFLDVVFFDEQHGIAVGAYGLFYRTMDGGVSWNAEMHATLLDPYDQEYLDSVREESEEFYLQELESILPHINRVTMHDDKLYLAGEAGLLAMTDDYGKNWQRYDVDYMGSFFDIAPLDDASFLAVGLRGNIFVMKDGATWEYVNTCDTSTLNSIHVINGEVHSLGNNGVIVSAQRPLTTSYLDPYANPASCEKPDNVSVTQVEDKSALLNAVSFNDKVIAVSSNGIKLLDL